MPVLLLMRIAFVIGHGLVLQACNLPVPYVRATLCGLFLTAIGISLDFLHRSAFVKECEQGALLKSKKVPGRGALKGCG